ncbi:hypothetical protein BIFBIF_00795 [Bifidobacterium bifidum ATCC 29521 = JCM 1255 = DSM 20456]|nr:hypothetical protein BIFBIF_00795 [Bifidobacterium bifidum ATCC 29521 = JCM 1255 = DSM 20456]
MATQAIIQRNPGQAKPAWRGIPKTAEYQRTFGVYRHLITL